VIFKSFNVRGESLAPVLSIHEAISIALRYEDFQGAAALPSGEAPDRAEETKQPYLFFACDGV